MMSVKWIVAFLSLAGGLVIHVGTGSAQKSDAESCNITITDPAPGSPVEDQGVVSGTAKIPSHSHLWILAHKKVLNGWWPQGGGETPIENGKWKVQVTYGLGNENGDFEVAAVALGDDASNSLDRWVATAPDRNYPPVKFPPAVGGCLPAKMTVLKR